MNVYVATKKYSQYDKISFLISCGLILALFFSFIYVLSSNELMSSQRIVKEKNEKLNAAAEITSQLEIKAAQFRFSQNLSEIASARDMVATSRIHYLDLNNDSSVAMMR